jgi:hypothetical protein
MQYVVVISAQKKSSFKGALGSKLSAFLHNKRTSVYIAAHKGSGKSEYYVVYPALFKKLQAAIESSSVLVRLCGIEDKNLFEITDYANPLTDDYNAILRAIYFGIDINPKQSEEGLVA